MASVVIRLEGVVLRRGPLTLLRDLDWTVGPGEHWALLGPNGAGKTLALRTVTGYVWPTDGRVTVLDRRLGEIDLRLLRRRIGWVSQAVADMTPGGTGVLEAILSGPQASMGLFVEPDRETVERAESLAEDFGLKDRLKRPFALLSSGERQRTLLARAALAEPELLILDEPMSGLDVGGRELFLNLTARLASGPGAPTIVMTTHNVQEIGAFMTHALLLKDGGASAAGPLAETLTEERLGELFDLPLRIERNAAGRWLAWLD